MPVSDLMKILMVTPSYFPIIGGSEVLTRNIAIRLNDIGIHADVLALNMKKKWTPILRKETEKDAMFKVYKVPAIGLFKSTKINPLYPLFRMNVIPKPGFTKIFREYDILHFIGEFDLSLPLFSYFAHVQKPKIMQHVGIYKAGGICEYYRRHVVLKTVFKRILPRLADLYIVFKDAEKELLSDLGVPMSRISTLPEGADIKTFRPGKTKKTDNLVLFVGRIYAFKGLHVLIKALSCLRIPTQLVVIGPEWDAEYVKKIKEMSNAVNEKSFHKVKFLGAMDATDLVPWYQQAAVVVCPYIVEASSLVTLEALACGTPVIGTGNDVLRNGVNGIVVPPRDSKKLADALKKLLEDSKLREKCGEEGRRIVEQYFSWERAANKLSRIYEAILRNQNTN